MKTLTATLQDQGKLQPEERRKMLALMKASARDFAGIAIAVLTAAIIITLSVWLAAMGANPVLGAGIWALGFVFVGWGLDSQGPDALLRAAYGCALPVLALLQDRVSADFLIVVGVLLAAWAARFLVIKLSVQ